MWRLQNVYSPRANIHQDKFTSEQFLGVNWHLWRAGYQGFQFYAWTVVGVSPSSRAVATDRFMRPGRYRSDLDQ